MTETLSGRLFDWTGFRGFGCEAAAVDPAHSSRAPPEPDRLTRQALRRLLLPPPPGLDGRVSP